MSGTTVRDQRSGRPSHGEPLLGRAFRLLAAFTKRGEGLGLGALASRAGMPKSTTLRIATQLVDVGALERRDNGEFVVGLRLLEIASLAPRGHGLREAALPFMEDLHRETRQHVLLAVRDGHHGVLVERLSSLDATEVNYRVGGRIPLDATGVGFALLAYAPDDVRRSVIDGPERSARNPLSPSHVRQLVAMARAEGVCVVTAPNPIGAGPAQITTVAAPILDGHGGALGAISLVSPHGERGAIALRLALRTASLAIARAASAS